jgi:hypothetical protein
MNDQPSKQEAEQRAEEVLARRGVFKGAHGLRGLAECQRFWDEQPYGTRLYYGPGIADYLHRGVLRSAVEALDASPSMEAVEGWRPIETAPKDGEVILLQLGKSWTAPGFWTGEGGGKVIDPADDDYPWLVMDKGSGGLNAVEDGVPTHWMPIPAPPTAAAPSSPSASPAMPLDVLYVLRQANEYVTHTPHGDNCHLTTEYPGNECICGKEALGDALHEVLMRVDAQYAAEALGESASPAKPSCTYPRCSCVVNLHTWAGCRATASPAQLPAEQSEMADASSKGGA